MLYRNYTQILLTLYLDLCLLVEHSLAVKIVWAIKMY